MGHWEYSGFGLVTIEKGLKITAFTAPRELLRHTIVDNLGSGYKITAYFIKVKYLPRAGRMPVQQEFHCIVL